MRCIVFKYFDSPQQLHVAFKLRNISFQKSLEEGQITSSSEDEKRPLPIDKPQLSNEKVTNGAPGILLYALIRSDFSDKLCHSAPTTVFVVIRSISEYEALEQRDAVAVPRHTLSHTLRNYLF
jgi:hypothetical protein